MKIQSIETITELAMGKIVHAHGCFDCLHPGHIMYLEKAKSMGDTLVATVTSDRYVNKGPNRPIFSAGDRVFMLSKLECVDYVTINDAPDACTAIKILQPDIYVKGRDYLDTDCEEFKTVRLMGGQVAFTNTPKYSTTGIIKKCKLV